MDTLMALWQLDGRGPYVWGSILMCALVFGLELASLWRRRRAPGVRP